MSRPPGPDILVVDDDVRNHTAVASMLEDIDVTLTFATSGREALSQLLSREFAVVLLDVKMPVMDGFETATLIRARGRTRHLPIIFMTSYGHDEADVRRGYQLGAVDYLFKPIVREALRAKVGVFADLHKRTVEICEQAERIREIERVDAVRRLEHERRRWEAEVLKQQMREQRRLNQQLAEMDARKNEFIAMLAHELRNPLAPLTSSLELIRLRAGDDPVLERARSAMQRQVQHLTRLVDDLLDVSRISRGKIELELEPTDLSTIVELAVESCAPAMAKANQKLRLHSPGVPVLILADAVRMTQVIQNLLNNAIRYSEPGGEIELQWGRDEDQAWVRVSDRGCGIAPELLERVFERFVQAHSRGPGLGLGLSLVKQITELHRGTVTATSKGEGQGSSFVVRLPLLVQSEAYSAEECPGAPVAEARPLRIAVVEDDTDVRIGLQDLLQAWGHRVEVAASGPLGVQLLLDQRPDIALLDLGLPGLDGYGVAREVRDKLGEGRPRLVALSGYGQQRDQDNARRAGFDAHLIKPASPEILQKVLTDLASDPSEVRPPMRTRTASTLS